MPTLTGNPRLAPDGQWRHRVHSDTWYSAGEGSPQRWLQLAGLHLQWQVSRICLSRYLAVRFALVVQGEVRTLELTPESTERVDVINRVPTVSEFQTG